MVKPRDQIYISHIGNLPWPKITGMRDFLIHDYIEVDNEIVWKAATQDVSELEKELEKYKNTL